MTGISPDGIVCNEGIIEIKCHISSIHFNNVKRGGYNPDYKWQYFFNLKESGADWIDTISFCSDFPKNKKLHVFRIWAKDSGEEFKMIDKRTAEFFKLVDEKKQLIEGL